jgi:CRISPR-associated exonuclease Cas4
VGRILTHDESDLLALSGLQHVVFCERQFALIHVEQVWEENVLTIEGRHLHEQVDDGEAESRGDVRVVRGVPLRSLSLGLSGRADVVELHRDPNGVPLKGLKGYWRPYPVEYKRGRPKSHQADEVQVCAQGMCLEEMLNVDVPAGALFYGRPRRRTEVLFDIALRELVRAAAVRIHELVERRETPRAIREPKCDRCSLLETCQPEAIHKSVRRYLAASLRAASQTGDT